MAAAAKDQREASPTAESVAAILAADQNFIKAVAAAISGKLSST